MNKSSCLIAYEKILSGENTYYRERLQDKEFVEWITYLAKVERAKCSSC